MTEMLVAAIPVVSLFTEEDDFNFTALQILWVADTYSFVLRQLCSPFSYKKNGRVLVHLADRVSFVRLCLTRLTVLLSLKVVLPKPARMQNFVT